MSNRNLNMGATLLSQDDVVSSVEFYAEYHGHKVDHLEKILPHLRKSSNDLIWTAGDSSLDNKFWFGTKAEAVGGYRDVLRPKQSKCDVTYWLNYLGKERFDKGESKSNFSAINTAGEMSNFILFTIL